MTRSDDNQAKVPNKIPTKKYMGDYCRSAFVKGYLTDEEHAKIDEWLPLHPEYEPHWILCTHTVPNQQRANGMCVFGDRDHWNTSYLKFNQPSGSNLRGRVMVACRNAIVPSRDNFLADYPSGYVGDHANPGGFVAIVDSFCAEYGMPSPKPWKNGGGHYLEPDAVTKFREYHDTRVEWEAFTPEEHRKVTKSRKQRG